MTSKIIIDTDAIFKQAQTVFQPLEKNLRYTVSRAINDSLVDSQTKMINKIKNDFTIRRENFLKRSIKITKFSNKNDLDAEIAVANIAGKPTADILSKFEEGGTKKASGNVAIPTDVVQPTKTRVVTKGKRPRNLKRAVKITTKKGQDLIIVHKGRGKRATTEVAYVLEPQVKIDDRLEFIPTITKEFTRVFQNNFSRRFDAEIAEKMNQK